MNTRRVFLQQAGALAAAAAAGPAQAVFVGHSQLIDCNVTIGHWPFRDLHGKYPPTFMKRLREGGVTSAWAGSFEGIFYRDLATANRLLKEACANHFDHLLLAAGSLNPSLPGWKDDVKRCADDHGMKIVRLHPNYHGYALDDPKFLELLAAATDKKLLIQIAAQMEDERTQYPLMRVPPVDLKPLPAALKQVPNARVMVLNVNRAMSMTALQGTNVTIDIAMLEGIGGIENLLKEWPTTQLVYGSHAPLFYAEAARLKLIESELTEEQRTAITHGNAQRLLSA